MTLDPQWQERPEMAKHLFAHEEGHNLWLKHCCVPPDLMTNPVGINHFTTDGDRTRIVNAYKNHGGKLGPGPVPEERMSIMELRRMAEEGRPLQGDVLLTYYGEDYAKASPL